MLTGFFLELQFGLCSRKRPVHCNRHQSKLFLVPFDKAEAWIHACLRLIIWNFIWKRLCRLSRIPILLGQSKHFGAKKRIAYSSIADMYTRVIIRSQLLGGMERVRGGQLDIDEAYSEPCGHGYQVCCLQQDSFQNPVVRTKDSLRESPPHEWTPVPHT